MIATPPRRCGPLFRRSFRKSKRRLGSMMFDAHVPLDVGVGDTGSVHVGADKVGVDAVRW